MGTITSDMLYNIAYISTEKMIVIGKISYAEYDIASD